MSVLPALETRVEIPELMDTTRLSDEELAGTLRFLETANRRLGGSSLIFGYLERWLRERPPNGQVSVLDVGTGGADFPVALAEWARGEGLRLRVTGLDSDPAVASFARRRTAAESAVDVVESDLATYSPGQPAFDFVIASLMLHHVPDAGLIDTLRRFDRLARRGVVISDLRRCASGYVGVKLLTAVWGNRVTRHDGPLSVRRAFREGELDGLAARAGLPYLKARRHPFFRVALAGEKPL